MLIKLILLLFLAHLLSDFIFQSQSMSNKKKEKIFTWHHFKHGIVVGVLSYLASLNINFWIAAIILAILHLLTDIAKSALQLKYPRKNFFFIDQAIHIFIISGVAIIYSFIHSIYFLFNIELSSLITIIGFVFITKPTNIIIANLLNVFEIEIPETKKKDESLPNAGKLIGIVERFLVLSLILIGEFASIGLILAAKSILRFNDTQKSEYVLVGTLLSFGFAVLIGIFITQVILK